MFFDVQSRWIIQFSNQLLVILGSHVFYLIYLMLNVKKKDTILLFIHLVLFFGFLKLVLNFNFATLCEQLHCFDCQTFALQTFDGDVSFKLHKLCLCMCFRSESIQTTGAAVTIMCRAYATSSPETSHFNAFQAIQKGNTGWNSHKNIALVW